MLLNLNRSQELPPPPPFGGTSPAKRGRDMRGDSPRGGEMLNGVKQRGQGL